jgi:hypothetical protein
MGAPSLHSGFIGMFSFVMVTSKIALYASEMRYKMKRIGCEKVASINVVRCYYGVIMFQNLCIIIPGNDEASDCAPKRSPDTK